MQVQAYNPEQKFSTLEEVITANPKAHSLHYKVGFSIGLYVKALNNVIPGLKDTVEGPTLLFNLTSLKLLNQT